MDLPSLAHRAAIYPISLDLAVVRVAVVGDGVATAKRVQQMLDAGATGLSIYAPNPGADLLAVAGELLIRRLPTEEEVAAHAVVWGADLPRPHLEWLAATARAAGRLVNIEDDIPLCDFHTPSLVRRGDLVLAISTGGKSPALARRIRRFLERCFGPEWAGRLDRLAELRQRWRAEGRDMPTVATLTEAELDRQGWMPKERCDECHRAE